MESWYRLKVQEIQTQSARQNTEHGYAKEEVKRLRTQLANLRGKLTDLEGRVSIRSLNRYQQRTLKIFDYYYYVVYHMKCIIMTGTSYRSKKKNSMLNK